MENKTLEQKTQVASGSSNQEQKNQSDIGSNGQADDQTASSVNKTEESNQSSQTVPLKNLEQLASSLLKAEERIQKQKKLIKKLADGKSEDDYVEKESLDKLLDRKLDEKLTSMKTVVEDDDSELREFRQIRQQNEELLEALKARQTISSGVASGSNQDKLEAEPELPKMDSLQHAMAERAAKRVGLTLKEWMKKRNLL